jgi:hypothetical protein
MALQEEIERLETLIARRRELFNQQVYEHNSRIVQLPGAILRPLFGWREVEMFRAEESARVPPASLPDLGEQHERLRR